MLAHPQQPQAFKVSKPERLTPRIQADPGLSPGLNPRAGEGGVPSSPRSKAEEPDPDSRLQAAQLEPGLFRYAKLLQGILWGGAWQYEPQPRSPLPYAPRPAPTLPVIFWISFL